MSKVLTILAAILAIPIVASVSVSAVEGDCTITDTGPDSNNTCTVSDSYTCRVENDTVIIVDSNNQQVATSGSASGTGNTGGGNVTSGSATNSNGITFDFTITNGEEGASPVCTVATVTTPDPVTPQPAGGSGATTGTTAAIATTPKPTVLANTSGSHVVVTLAGIIAALVLATGVVRGVAILRSRL